MKNSSFFGSSSSNSSNPEPFFYMHIVNYGSQNEILLIHGNFCFEYREIAPLPKRFSFLVRFFSKLKVFLKHDLEKIVLLVRNPCYCTFGWLGWLVGHFCCLAEPKTLRYISLDLALKGNVRQFSSHDLDRRSKL